MLESFYILAIVLIVIAIVSILGFRLFISRRQQKKGKMNYQEDAAKVPIEVSNPTILIPDLPKEKTMIVVQTQNKEKEPKIIEATTVEKTESTLNKDNSSLYQIPWNTDNLTDVNEKGKENFQIESEESVVPNHSEGFDQADEDTFTKTLTKSDPEKRGGAHRGKREKYSNEIEVISEKSARSRKSEIVCWQQSRKWFLGIEIPDEYLDQTDLTVFQGSEELIKETDLRWKLTNIHNNVKISSHLVTENVQLNEKESPYLLFKLSGQNLTKGRRVRYATSGTFLVVVPEEWRRNEQLSGIPQVPPTKCNLAGFNAHLFYMDLETEYHIAFLTSKDEVIEISNQNSQFGLTGSSIADASETMGPLFGRILPELNCREHMGWKNISTVVIGEEGEKISGWRTSFSPQKELEKQGLKELMQSALGGWYFIRIYDTDGNLVESLDFRFAVTLENITIAPHNVLPGDQGHKPVRIDFYYFKDSSFKLLLPINNQLKKIVSDSGTSVEIPPDPDYDKTDWILQIDKNSKVELSLLVERVWWSIHKQDINLQKAEWMDKPIVLSSLQFLSASKYTLRIRFPQRRWTKEVLIGFEQRKARPYQVEVTQQIVEIPMNHFEGASELEDITKDHPFKVWINGFSEQTIAVLSHLSLASKQDRPKLFKVIRLNTKRLIKYLNRLDRTTNDAALSELIKGCKRNWLTPDSKARRDEYLLQTACVIKISWRVMRARGMKPIGRRRGWIRRFIQLAESNTNYLNAINKKFEALTNGSKSSTMQST